MRDVSKILERFFSVRTLTQKICAPLALEDYGLQPMPDTSPPKWHLAHTTWFFENFILKEYAPHYREVNQHYGKLFNSYYNSVGPQAAREHRGGEARPLVSEVMMYRQKVTEAILELFQRAPTTRIDHMLELLELGIQHEQQHQELLVMDMKYILGRSMIKAPYLPQEQAELPAILPDSSFEAIEGGLVEVGRDPGDGFCYDNEAPRHRVYLNDFQIQRRPISNKEFLGFMLDGGYQNPLLWKSDGWVQVQQSSEHCPLYWFQHEGQWWEYTLHGIVPLRMAAPVTHISFFEADAFANWTGDRLLTEFEWERAASKVPASDLGFFDFERLEAGFFPLGDSGFYSLRGCAWEWTSSSYGPYPGHQRPGGFREEYNYKFMNGQRVLKGGSYATSQEHYRDSYRNFFYPHQKWAITGLRLAKDM